MRRYFLLLVTAICMLLLPVISIAQDDDTTIANEDTWWNERVFYEIFVRSFYDSDGDGIGDIQGVISQLDYLNDGDPNTTDDLGITGIWLMPMAQSPSYHGYDVTDYYTIEADYGTNEDFLELIDEAHARGIAVIVDLVMNHTSREHPWFIDATTNPESEYVDWYILEDENPNFTSQTGSRVWHPIDDQYFFSVFCSCMPELDYTNEAVTAEMYEVTRFWLEEMNVDGFRLDAIRHLIEDGRILENTGATHRWLQDYHDYVHELKPDVLLVGEIWESSGFVASYVPNEVDIAFEFDLASAILRSASFGTLSSLTNQQEVVLDIYPSGQFATFLTNHDQNRVMSHLRGDVGKAQISAFVMLTNVGVPFIYYGEEIGMFGIKPDELIRTPMQWDDTLGTGGFTIGTPWQALDASYPDINVANQTDNPDSLLSAYRDLIHVRNQSHALQYGDFTFVTSDTRRVYSFLRQSEEETVLVVLNFDDDPKSGYTLSLESGNLGDISTASLLYGEGDIMPPEINANGGFDAYALPEIPPYRGLIIRLD